MGLEFEVSGSARLHEVAARIRAVGDKGLGREMASALRTVAAPVQEAVRDESDRVMPQRGGYRALLAESLRFRTRLTSGPRNARLRLVLFADGKAERRDVVRLNRGELRHPIFGKRWRPWAATSIRSGFFDRGTDGAADQAEHQMVKVLDDFAKRLI